MSVAFPISMGLALVIGVLWSFAMDLRASPVLVLTGAALVLLAVIVNAKAYRAYVRARQQAQSASQPPVKAPDPAGRKRTPSPGVSSISPRRISIKAIVVSVASGVLMGSFYPLIQISREGELGLGPYAAALIFTCGIFVSTMVYNMILMNLPLQGEPLEVVEYFHGSAKNHLLGLTGGIVWCTGMIAYFVATSAPPEANIGPAMSLAALQGVALISALWGMLAWKEFSGANSKVRGLLALMLLLFGLGLTSVSIAPLYSTEDSVRYFETPSESDLPGLPESSPIPGQ
jgi:glucose uptake protein